MIGRIRNINKDKGYAFLKAEDGKDYFMHRSALQEGTDFDALSDNQSMEFEATEGQKGPRAENVSPV
jgi:CspA family cold shock protein